MKLVFTRSTTFQSRLIRFVETLYGKFYGGYSQWSHVACVLQDGVSVMDSMRELGGVTEPRPLDVFLTEFPDHIIIDVPLRCEGGAESFLRSQIGKSYDIKAYWGYFTGLDTEDPNAWYCYELVYAALAAGGMVMTPMRDRITCNKLLQMVAPAPRQKGLGALF